MPAPTGSAAGGVHLLLGGLVGLRLPSPSFVFSPSPDDVRGLRVVVGAAVRVVLRVVVVLVHDRRPAATAAPAGCRRRATPSSAAAPTRSIPAVRVHSRRCHESYRRHQARAAPAGPLQLLDLRVLRSRNRNRTDVPLQDRLPRELKGTQTEVIRAI